MGGMTDQEIDALVKEAEESFAECEASLTPLTDEDRADGLTEESIVCTACKFEKKLIAAIKELQSRAMSAPIETLTVAMLLRLRELRPEMHEAIVAELRRRGVQVVL